MRVIIFLVLFNSVVVGQRIEDGWKNIKPLHTNQAKVEKLLGKPIRRSSDYPTYDTSDAFLQVTYATGACENDSLGRGEYNVPRGTVLRYDLQIKKQIDLADFNFQRKKYVKKMSGDVINLRDYYNAEDGITITVTVQGNTEYLNIIRFGPGKKNAEKFKCEKGLKSTVSAIANR